MDLRYGLVGWPQEWAGGTVWLNSLSDHSVGVWPLQLSFFYLRGGRPFRQLTDRSQLSDNHCAEIESVLPASIESECVRSNQFLNYKYVSLTSTSQIVYEILCMISAYSRNEFVNEMMMKFSMDILCILISFVYLNCQCQWISENELANNHLS